VKIDVVIDALRRADVLVGAPESTGSDLTGVVEDSRQVQPGNLFCAIEGSIQDGHAYLADAEALGAGAALVVRRAALKMPQVIVSDSRVAAGVAAREWYGRPGEQLELFAVTGTNGKSTTVAILRHLLNGDQAAASLGTLGAVDGLGARLEGYGPLTTPGPVEFQAVLADLRARGVARVALEASSHGLDQRRLEAVRFKVGVYTNLTHEHLDYHGSLERYAAAKMQLSRLLQADGVEVVNVDDPVWRGMARHETVRRIYYGRGQEAEVRVIRERLTAAGADTVFSFAGEEHSVAIPLLGEYNVTNAAAAAAAAWSVGTHPEEICLRMADVPQVPGRMERLAKCEFNVLRDYAHTPDGFERAIRAVKEITPGRLIVLFGCGGDRDREKRPEMGRIAAAGSDLVVIAMDNPRTEDPEAILDDIAVGIGTADHLRILDREEAIRHAVSLLETGDCLLLLGKGHETYQIVGAEKLPFDEPSIVRSAVAGRA
jgi:UDP-N-acetylmuramoyl-L-alanyl-D-glutamate--2,6-diaminopimelate ligase